MEMVPPYDLHSFVTMATYWVTDFCVLKALLHCTNHWRLTFIVQLSELKPHLNDLTSMKYVRKTFGPGLKF